MTTSTKIKSKIETYQTVFSAIAFIVLTATMLGFFTGIFSYYSIVGSGTFHMATVSNNSLVAYWDFNLAPLSIVTDSISGYKGHVYYGGNSGAQLKTDAVYTGGAVKDQSLLFSGFRSYVDLSENNLKDIYGNKLKTFADPALQSYLTSAITVSMWVKPDKALALMAAAFPHLILRTGSFEIYFTKNGYLAVRVEDADGKTTHDFINYTKLSLSTTAWNHIAWTYDSQNSKNSSLYINGIRVSSAIAPSALHAQTTQANASFTISSFANSFEGKIDEVKIYNYALSAVEVDNIFITATCNQTRTTGKFVGNIQAIDSANQPFTAGWEKRNAYSIISDPASGASMTVAGGQVNLDKVSFWICKPSRSPVNNSRPCFKITAGRYGAPISDQSLSWSTDFSNLSNSGTCAYDPKNPVIKKCNFYNNFGFGADIFNNLSYFDNFDPGAADRPASGDTMIAVCPTSVDPIGFACRCGEQKIKIVAGCNGSASCDQPPSIGCLAGETVKVNGADTICSCDITAISSNSCPLGAKSSPPAGAFIPTVPCSTPKTNGDQICFIDPAKGGTKVQLTWDIDPNGLVGPHPCSLLTNGAESYSNQLDPKDEIFITPGLDKIYQVRCFAGNVNCNPHNARPCEDGSLWCYDYDSCPQYHLSPLWTMAGPPTVSLSYALPDDDAASTARNKIKLSVDISGTEIKSCSYQLADKDGKSIPMSGWTDKESISSFTTIPLDFAGFLIANIFKFTVKCENPAGATEQSVTVKFYGKDGVLNSNGDFQTGWLVPSCEIPFSTIQNAFSSNRAVHVTEENLSGWVSVPPDGKDNTETSNKLGSGDAEDLTALVIQNQCDYQTQDGADNGTCLSRSIPADTFSTQISYHEIDTRWIEHLKEVSTALANGYAIPLNFRAEKWEIESWSNCPLLTTSHEVILVGISGNSRSGYQFEIIDGKYPNKVSTLEDCQFGSMEITRNDTDESRTLTGLICNSPDWSPADGPVIPIQIGSALSTNIINQYDKICTSDLAVNYPDLCSRNSNNNKMTDWLKNNLTTFARPPDNCVGWVNFMLRVAYLVDFSGVDYHPLDGKVVDTDCDANHYPK